MSLGGNIVDYKLNEPVRYFIFFSVSRIRKARGSVQKILDRVTFPPGAFIAYVGSFSSFASSTKILKSKSYSFTSWAVTHDS